MSTEILVKIVTGVESKYGLQFCVSKFVRWSRCKPWAVLWSQLSTGDDDNKSLLLLIVDAYHDEERISAMKSELRGKIFGVNNIVTLSLPDNCWRRQNNSLARCMLLTVHISKLMAERPDKIGVSTIVCVNNARWAILAVTKCSPISKTPPCLAP